MKKNVRIFMTATQEQKDCIKKLKEETGASQTDILLIGLKLG